MANGNRGIRSRQRKQRKVIAKWHTDHSVSLVQTAKHFCISEYLVKKSLVENNIVVPPSNDSLRNTHINNCVEIILAISELLDIASAYEYSLWKKVEAELVDYKDSLEAQGPVIKDFFRRYVNLPQRA